jgi:capsular polysaccharide biosynthesis protein
MEARRYWQILRRRGWVAVLLVLLVAVMEIAFHKPAPTTYVATMRFSVGVVPEQGNGAYYTYDRYYTWLTAEYLVDDLAEIVRSSAFAQEVSKRLDGVNVPPGAIQASTQTGRLHRILTVQIRWGEKAQLQAIAEAAAATLQDENARFFASLGGTNARAILIDPPSIARQGPGMRQKLEFPLRLTLAALAGLALALLWEYLDDSARDARDLEEMGLPILGTIPGKKKLFWK